MNTSTSENHAANTAALALLEAWYVTPDDRPPGYWDALLAECEALPFLWEGVDLPSP